MRATFGSLALLLVFGCASSRPSDTDAKLVEAGRSSRAGGDAAGKGAAGGTAVAGARAASAGRGVASECLGPGRYERGKGSVYRPCCDGLKEIPTGKTGYSGSANSELEPSCDPPPLAVFACVRGSCGDGVCEEEGEAPACGCVEDCPQAAFTWSDTARLGKLSAAPASCKLAELLAVLQPTAARDCGDLALGASAAERDASLACAREAIAASKPFQVFWRTQGTDSIVHSGVVGRSEGGALETFQVYVDADVFSINFSGATAAWFPCTLGSAAACESGPAECLSCPGRQDSVSCGCLPKGARPGAPPGSSLELRCEKN